MRKLGRIIHSFFRDPTVQMKSASALRLIQLTIAACAGVLAVSFAPSDARAECGDYVIVGRSLLNPSNASPELRLRLALMPNSTSATATDHHGRVPCHGPSCSKREPVPAPSGPHAVLTTGATELAYLTDVFQSPKCDALNFTVLASSLLPRGFPIPIEHPPRTV